MILKITKTCQGVLDTRNERIRIRYAFKRDPEVRRRLLALMDAIEAGQWKRADRMLRGKWWKGYDKKAECPRGEFVGMLNLANPDNPRFPASGFDGWAGYADLVWVMSQKREPGSSQFKVEKVG